MTDLEYCESIKRNLSQGRPVPIEVKLGLPYVDDVTDYHFSSLPSDSEERRNKGSVGDIYANMAKCLKCNTVIRSKNRHDYRTCPCGSLSVDGGSWYLKRSGTLDSYEDMSVMYDDVKDST